MACSVRNIRGFTSHFVAGDLSGAVGDSVTVLPIVVAVSMLSDLSLALMLVWFGVFQIIWGGYYRVPMSVEPMKALAGLVLAGALTTGEFLVGGLLAGAVLVVLGTTGTLGWLNQYLGARVVRGIQLAVALLLLEAGLGLVGSNPRLAGGAGFIALVVIVLGYWNLSALIVLVVGGVVAVGHVGWPTMTVPAIEVFAHLSPVALSENMVGATAGQLAMTIGNAAVATSLLVGDYFNRDVSSDELATSMGAMNVLAVP